MVNPATIAGVTRQKPGKGDQDIIAGGTTGHIRIEHAIEKELNRGDSRASCHIKRSATDEGDPSSDRVGARTLNKGFEPRLHDDAEELKHLIRDLVEPVDHTRPSGLMRESSVTARSASCGSLRRCACTLPTTTNKNVQHGTPLRKSPQSGFQRACYTARTSGELPLNKTVVVEYPPQKSLRLTSSRRDLLIS